MASPPVGDGALQAAQQHQQSPENPHRPSADAAALAAAQQREASPIRQPSTDGAVQQQQQTPPKQLPDQPQQQQPLRGNTAPSQSGQNGPQGPPTMSANGLKKIYQIRNAQFEVDPNYEVIKAIGIGAYGLVCSAKDANTGRFVAIKKMPKLFDDLVDGRRVLREIRILRWLGKHPQLLELIGVSRPSEISDHERQSFREIYFVTELLDADLSQLLRSRQRLSIDHHAFISFQLLCALAYIHNAGVIHRDLKPSNILVNASCEIRVCDFGLSRSNVPLAERLSENNQQQGDTAAELMEWMPEQQEKAQINRNAVKRYTPFATNVSPANGSSSSSNNNMTMGMTTATEGGSPTVTPMQYELTEYVVTRWYRPPELLLGVGYNHSVDLWSIGCIFMEIVTRRPLFDGRNYLEQLEKIAEIVPMPAPEHVPTMLMKTRNQEPAKCVENLRTIHANSQLGSRGGMGSPELEQAMENAKYDGCVRRLMRYLKLPAEHAAPTMPMARAVDLISKLLVFHQCQRYTAAEALRHPFMAKHSANEQLVQQRTTYRKEHAAECLRLYRSAPGSTGVGALEAFGSGQALGECAPYNMWAFDMQPRISEKELRAEFWVDMCLNPGDKGSSSSTGTSPAKPVQQQ